jgi:hypothetical protein
MATEPAPFAAGGLLAATHIVEHAESNMRLIIAGQKQ